VSPAAEQAGLFAGVVEAVGGADIVLRWSGSVVLALRSSRRWRESPVADVGFADGPFHFAVGLPDL
jgi:hypothetical protein